MTTLTRKARILLALALTLPLYLSSCLLLRHPFTLEYEGYARELLGR